MRPVQRLDVVQAIPTLVPRSSRTAVCPELSAAGPAAPDFAQRTHRASGIGRTCAERQRAGGWKALTVCGRADPPSIRECSAHRRNSLAEGLRLAAKNSERSRSSPRHTPGSYARDEFLRREFLHKPADLLLELRHVRRSTGRSRQARGGRSLPGAPVCRGESRPRAETDRRRCSRAGNASGRRRRCNGTTNPMRFGAEVP